MKNINRETIEVHYSGIMRELGIERNADNADTPLRVAKALIEMTENEGKDPYEELAPICTTFECVGSSLVEQDGITISSMCSHHHLPFIGKVYIRYIPGAKIIGLSKFARIAEWFAKKPQVQEDLTTEIYDFLIEILQPEALEVEIYDCTHTCMCARGVRSEATTTTRRIYRPDVFEKYYARGGRK